MSAKNLVGGALKAIFKIPDPDPISSPYPPRRTQPDPAPTSVPESPAEPIEEPDPGFIPEEEDEYDEYEEQQQEERRRIAERCFGQPPRTPLPADPAPTPAQGAKTEPQTPEPAHPAPPRERDLFTVYALRYVVEGCPEKFATMEEVSEHYFIMMTVDDGSHQKYPPTMAALRERITKDLESKVIRQRGYYVCNGQICDPVPDELNDALLQDLERQRGIQEEAPSVENPPAEPASAPPEEPHVEGSPTTPPAPAPVAPDPAPEPEPPTPAPEPPQAPTVDEQMVAFLQTLESMPGGVNGFLALAQALAANAAQPEASASAPPATPLAPDPAPEPPVPPSAPQMPGSFVPLGNS